MKMGVLLNMKVAVIGAGSTVFGELFGRSYADLVLEAVKECLNSVDKGFELKEVEAIWLSTAIGTLIRREGCISCEVADTLRLYNLPITRVENACSSGGDAIRNAAFAVAAGIYDKVLVIGAEKMRDVPSRDTVIAFSGELRHQWWHPRGLTAPGWAALYAVAHMNQYGTKEEQFAEVAVKNHEYGSMNPKSQFKFKVTLEQVMNSPVVAWPIRLLHCCPVTDGAAAVILANPEIAKKYTDAPVYLVGTGLAVDSFYMGWRESYTYSPAMVSAAKQAYKMARIEPKDVDVAELHDCFSPVEIMLYEDLGFCPKGEGGKFIEEGLSRLGGKVPCNLSGGLKTKGHPIGATGVGQAYEIWKQLRGEAGKVQVNGAEIGLTCNWGGPGSIGVVNIYRRP